jgi:hypothetical protein
MRLRLGVDDRLLAIFLAACCVVGCIAQPGGKTPAKPKPATTTTIEELSFQSCQARDRAVADALDSVAKRIDAGEIKYDAMLQTELGKSFVVGDSTPEDKRLSAAMVKVLSPGETFDASETAKALRQLAAGRRRAGK